MYTENKKVECIIWGCGEVGKKARAFVEGKGDVVCCFVDNNPETWNTKNDGLPVISPAEIKMKVFDYVAIGVYKQVESVRKQLVDLGVDVSKITVPIEPVRIFKNTTNEECIYTLSKSEYMSDNTVRFNSLNIPADDTQFTDKLEDLKKVLYENNIPRHEVLVVGGAVLQAYGLRSSDLFDDIDVIMTERFRKLYGRSLIILSSTAEMHCQNEYILPDDTLICDPKYHFVYHDLLFLSLDIELIRQSRSKKTQKITF